MKQVKRRPNGTQPDPVRSVRCSDLVWEKARRRATFEGVTMSHVLLTIIEGYAAGMIDLPRVTVQYRQPQPYTAVMEQESA